MAFDQGHALVVGVGSYQHAPRIDVPIAVADSRAVASALRDPALCGYPPDQVELLTDQSATRDGLLAALERLAQRAGPGDTAFLFHVGHGDYGTDGAYYLLSHDSRVEGGKVAAGSGVSQAELLEALKKVPAKRVLAVFNTCHSAELSPALSLEPAFGAQVLPDRAAEALLSTGSGRIILTACKEEQLSFTGRGALSWFTQALVDALHGQGVTPRGGAISAFDLYTSVYELVRKRVLDELGREQDPVLTVLKGVGPFAVALYRGNSGDLGLAEALPAPETGFLRPVSEEASLKAYQQIVGDWIDARSSQGFLNRPTGPVEQHFGDRIDTGGGAYVGGSVNTGGGAFVGRDQSVIAGRDQFNIQGTSIGNFNVVTGLQSAAPEPRRYIAESLRLDVAVPSSVFVDEYFWIAVAVKQTDSPPLKLEDLDQVTSAAARTYRADDQDTVKYKVTVQAPDFEIVNPSYVFRLKSGEDSQPVFFQMRTGREGNHSISISAFQVDVEEELVAQTRLLIIAKVKAVSTTLEIFLSAIADLRAALPAAGLDEGTHLLVEGDLRSVEEAAREPQPNKGLIAHRLKGVRALLEETSGAGAVGIGLSQKAAQLVELAGRLFG